MGATGNKGVDVRQTGNRLIFRALLQDSSNAILTSGTTNIALLELQDDGTVKTYDWSSNTFKTSGMTSSNSVSTMTHRTRITDADASVNLGLWTKVLSTLSGFTAGAIYFAVVTNTGATPSQQVREFQYGGLEGDLADTADGTGVSRITIDMTQTLPTNPTANTTGEALLLADTMRGRRGTAQAGGASTITLDSGAQSSDDRYNGYGIFLLGGTGGGLPGTGQFRTILDYVGSTKVATVDFPWGTAPDATTTFILIPNPKADVGMWATDYAGVSVNANHRPDVNVKEYNSQTADTGTDTFPKVSLWGILGSLLDEGATGRIRDAWKKAWNVASSVWTALDNNQSGDNYARLGPPAGASIAADIAANLTAIQNIQNNTFIATSIPLQLERPDSGSESVQISIVFCDETGTAKNLDSGNPIITLVNNAGTDLSSRLGSWTNPATGKYVVPYDNSSAAALDGLHWDVSGTINSKLRRLPAFTQIVDTTAVDFTAADRTKLDGVFAKLPSKAFLAGTVNSDGDIQLDESTGDFNATQQTRIQTQAAAALNVYDPPTRTEATSDKDAIIAAVGTPLQAANYVTPVGRQGTVTAVVSQFEIRTDLTEVDGFWRDHPLRFRTGSNTKAVRPIRTSDQANGTIYFTNGDGFPATIQVGDQFDILEDHIHSVADIAAETVDAFSQQATSPSTPGTVLAALDSVGDAVAGIVNEFSDAALLQMRSSMKGVVIVPRGPAFINEDDVITLELVIGDDYLDGDGRAIQWDLDGATLPDLTDAVVTLNLRSGPTQEIVTVTGSPTVPTGATRTIRFEPTSAQTALLTVNEARKPGTFDVLIIDAAGHKIRPNELQGVLICRTPLA